VESSRGSLLPARLARLGFRPRTELHPNVLENPPLWVHSVCGREFRRIVCCEIRQAFDDKGKACFFEALVSLTSACLPTVVRAEDRTREVSFRSSAPFLSIGELASFQFQTFRLASKDLGQLRRALRFNITFLFLY